MMAEQNADEPQEEPHYCEDCHGCHVGECHGYGVDGDE